MNADTSSFAKTRFHLRRGTWLKLIAMTAWTFTAITSPCMASPIDEDDKRITPSATLLNEDSEYAGQMTAEGRYRVTAKFQDFSGEALAVGFELRPDESREALQEFGFSRAELEALRDRCNAGGSCDQQEFARETKRYYQAHALRITPNPGAASRLSVDVAEVVSRNRERVQPVADALRQLAAERGYDQRWLVEAAIALVQSGIPYRRPPSSEQGRSVLGFYPPPTALERGYGDCDTKAALLAAILMNLGETQIIGVHVPDHYLLGIAATPRANEAYISYQGRTYVLVEAAGPARRQPGEVSEFTQTALKKQTGLRVDPMF